MFINVWLCVYRIESVPVCGQKARGVRTVRDLKGVFMYVCVWMRSWKALGCV